MKYRTPIGSFLQWISVLAFSLAVACSATADAAKPAPPSDFLIETQQSQGPFTASGRFSASGAIRDRGEAWSFSPDFHLELYGKHGDLLIDLWRDADGAEFFTILDATLDYAGLVGISGLAASESKVKRNGDIIVYRTLLGSIGP
jgi:hypothetical protein